MRKRAMRVFSFAVAAALIAFTAVDTTTLAQSGPTTQGIAADDLFWPYDATGSGPADSGPADFRPGGVERLLNIVRQAQTPGSQCPIDVEFTVIDSSSPDQLVSEAAAMARREVIKEALGGFGPAVRVTGNATTGLVSMVMISTQAAKDKEPPTLATTSVPAKGSKVEVGDSIVVTMAARDDANGWQTGIQTIQLIAESEGNLLVPSAQSYQARPRHCGNVPEPRTHVIVYTVPSCDPPVVRLRALVDDFANNHDTQVAEFPVDCEDEDEDQDPGSGQDAGGQGNPCVRRNIVRGLDFSFICP